MMREARAALSPAAERSGAMFDLKAYYPAYSVREALRLGRKHPEARYIAGGSDLLIKLREGKLSDASLIGLRGVREAREIALRTVRGLSLIHILSIVKNVKGGRFWSNSLVGRIWLGLKSIFLSLFNGGSMERKAIIITFLVVTFSSACFFLYPLTIIVALAGAVIWAKRYEKIIAPRPSRPQRRSHTSG